MAVPKAGSFMDDQDVHSGYYDPPSGGKAYDTGLLDSTSNEERLQEIYRREQAALALQQELDDREEKLTSVASKKGLHLPKNWPPYFRIARNAISRDIPEEYQWDVRKFYSLWILTAIATSFNFIIGFWYGTSPDGQDDDSLDVLQWLVILGYMFVGLPTAWMLWYKKFYNAIRTKNKVPQLFFMFLMLHIAWSAVMAVGLVMTGSFGALFMGDMYANGHDALGTCALLNTCLWGLSGTLGVLLLKIGQRALGRQYATEYLAENGGNIGSINGQTIPDTEDDDDIFAGGGGGGGTGAWA